MSAGSIFQLYATCSQSSNWCFRPSAGLLVESRGSSFLKDQEGDLCTLSSVKFSYALSLRWTVPSVLPMVLPASQFWVRLVGQTPLAASSPEPGHGYSPPRQAIARTQSEQPFHRDTLARRQAAAIETVAQRPSLRSCLHPWPTCPSLNSVWTTPPRPTEWSDFSIQCVSRAGHPHQPSDDHGSHSSLPSARH